MGLQRPDTAGKADERTNAPAAAMVARAAPPPPRLERAQKADQIGTVLVRQRRVELEPVLVEPHHRFQGSRRAIVEVGLARSQGAELRDTELADVGALAGQQCQAGIVGVDRPPRPRNGCGGASARQVSRKTGRSAAGDGPPNVSPPCRRCRGRAMAVGTPRPRHGRHCGRWRKRPGTDCPVAAAARWRAAGCAPRRSLTARDPERPPPWADHASYSSNGLGGVWKNRIDLPPGQMHRTARGARPIEPSRPVVNQTARSTRWSRSPRSP